MHDLAIWIICGSRVTMIRRHARLDRSVDCRRVVGNQMTIWLHRETRWRMRLRVDETNVGVEIGEVAGRWASTTTAVFLLMELTRATTVRLATAMAMKKRGALNRDSSVPLLVLGNGCRSLSCAWNRQLVCINGAIGGLHTVVHKRSRRTPLLDRGSRLHVGGGDRWLVL